LYRSQGLLQEAIGKYEAAVQMIRRMEAIKNKDAVLKGLLRKIQETEKALQQFRQTPPTKQVPADVQDLIKKKFAFAADSDLGALEGTIALAKFGQYDRALTDFRALLDKETVRFAAAKNIIRCHMALESYDNGIAEYHQWVSDQRLSADNLEHLRIFFQDLLDKRSIQRNLDQPAEPVDVSLEEIEIAPEPSLETAAAESAEAPQQPEEDLLDISSIGIFMEEGPRKGQTVEFDVSFQSGSEISLLIPNRDRQLIEHFRVGSRLGHIEFYSPFAIFKGAGIITSNTKIATGPKRGDFSLDIKVTRD
jgi:tetratricopeptide (TPR) repeat protein